MKSIFSKLTSVALAATIVGGGFSINASASELEANNLDADGFSSISSFTSGDSTKAASWGKGTLHYKDFPGSYPQAYSITETHAGNVYRITSQVASSNNGLGTTTSTKGDKYNTNIVQCGGLVSKTEKTTFTSTHGLQDTSTSGWQYASNEKVY